MRRRDVEAKVEGLDGRVARLARKQRDLQAEVTALVTELDALHSATMAALDAVGTVHLKLAEFLVGARLNPEYRDPIVDAIDEQLKAVVAVAQVGA